MPFDPNKSYKASGVKHFNSYDALGSKTRQFNDTVSGAVAGARGQSAAAVAARVRQFVADSDKKRRTPRSNTHQRSGGTQRPAGNTPAWLRNGGNKVPGGPFNANKTQAGGGFGAVSAPTAAWRPGTPSKRRLGSLQSGSNGFRSGNAKTLTSNGGFGRVGWAGKNSLFAVSSERVAGSVGLMTNPQTRLMQSLPLYVAYRGAQFFSEWNKESGLDWRDSMDQTIKKMERNPISEHGWKQVQKAGRSVLTIAGDVGAGIIQSAAYWPIVKVLPKGAEDTVGAYLSQLASLYSETADWLSDPSKGMSDHPVTVENNRQDVQGKRYHKLRDDAADIARDIEVDKFEKAIDRSRDMLYMRGVTDLKAFKSSFKNSPRVQAHLEALAAEARSMVRTQRSGDYGTDEQMLRVLRINRPDIYNQIYRTGGSR